MPPASLPLPASSAPAGVSLDLRVQAELLRTAYHDSVYGAPFGSVVALLFAYAALGAFRATVVLPWLAFALGCNLLRLLSRWAYLRKPVPVERTGRWRAIYVAVSAATGLSWGVGAWIFYTPHDSIYRVMVVLALAGLTTGASRLLAPVVAANLAYVYCSIGPLMARVLADADPADTRSYVLTAMCVLYLIYMSIAARQQVHALQRTVRLGHEKAALVESLGAAKERAENLNRDLSAEIARREIVETELRAATERALSASRAKSDFLATMSLEIRTPMNGIIGMLRIIRDSPLNATQREQVETAASSADTLLDLLSNIIDFSNIETGQLNLEWIAYSPAALARSVTELLRPRATAKGLALELEFPAGVPGSVIGDPARVRQVLFNLVGNAIKFTERGQVRLRIALDPPAGDAKTISFAVSDTGIGISADVLERLFQPFTRADRSMNRRFGGTGLGLAISQKLVEAMGGALTAHSVVGQGSEFQLSLPLARPERPGNPVEATTFVMPIFNGRVLVVEDDRINQRVIRYFLNQMGLETGLAEDGEAAVAIALRQDWDAVLMDCQLPGVDGLEATRQIRARQPDRLLPIIAITANVEMQDRRACLAAGMNDFLTKPIRVELLAASLQRWLPPERQTAANATARSG